jgi:small subunit ribosomal protein S9
VPGSKKVLVVSGKRKTALAKAVIKQGKGRIRINRIPIEILEPEIAKEKIMEPLLEAGEEIYRKVDITINVRGGGYMGQAEASRMALAKALWQWTKSSHLKNLFIKYDRTLIAGDSRRSESKKPGGSSARSKDQKSYR